MTVKKPVRPYKTVNARPGPETMLKPGELIDVVEMSPLTLVDRRTYNLLIASAWKAIDQPVRHVIAKSELRGLHESNDRIGESIERLMTAFVRVYTQVNDKPAIERAQLLGPTTETRAPDGMLYYRFSDEMRAIIRNSSIFARLRRDVIFALKSKYALALYEIIQKRGNLDWKRSEEFDIERFRQLLGVEPGRLKEFKHFNVRAIQPAVVEVNGLSDFGCRVEPVLTGRKVIKVKLSWWLKNTNELKTAFRELQAAKVGRRARLKGTVDRIIANAEELPVPRSKPGQ
jgi:Initiator Rep protein, WH2/Initiator Replication protein, WH1